MKKYFVIITIVLYSDLQVHAQEIDLSIGYGTFAMGDLKQLNDESVKQTDPVQLKLTNNFPGYLMLGLGASFPLSESYLLGGQLSLMSTGSRASYSDYSGSLELDQKLLGINIAIIPAIVVTKDERNLFAFDAKIGATFTSHDIISRLTLGGTEEKEAIELKSLNFFVEPGFRYRRSLSNLLFLSIRAGYNSNVTKGKLYLKEDDEAYLTVNGNPARADWSGFRAEAMISFNLK